MTEDDVMSINELVSNPTTRVPVCLCLDVSGSMGGSPINELNSGVRLFYDSIRDDEIAVYAAEICIVTFGDDSAEKLQDFSTLQSNQNPPHLNAGGMTPMGEAVNLALDLLEERKSQYQNNGVDYFQPWLVLMTDGAPNGSSSELQRAINRTCDLINNKKLTIFPIGIGADADMNVLKQFSPKRPPLKLQGLKFKEFFSWLSKSVSTTSQSMPGDEVRLDVDGIQGWGTLYG